ncbi:hypothetical protein ACLOJK_029480 [Asimina triloba]
MPGGMMIQTRHVQPMMEMNGKAGGGFGSSGLTLGQVSQQQSQIPTFSLHM